MAIEGKPEEETFLTSTLHLRPGIRASIPLHTELGPIELLLKSIQEHPDDTSLLVATGITQIPGSDEVIATRDIVIPKEDNRIRVGEPLDMDPDKHHTIIKSKKLWGALGAATVSLAGIAITRKVRHRKTS